MNKFKAILPLFLILGLIIWTACKKDDDNKSVQASFTFQLSETPGEVTFTNQSANADVYTWNFGDGSSSTMINPVHTYDENNSLIVILKATGGSGSDTFQDTVMVSNIP